jgi:hypothetical protein
MRDESTGREFLGGKEYSNGKYTFTGVPQGKFYVNLEYDGAAPAGWGYPGDYTGNAIVNISDGTDTVFQDIDCNKLIHLVSPADNALALSYDHDSIPKYSNNEISFDWDAIAEATSYNYMVYVENNEGGTMWTYGNTQETEIELVFDDNNAGEYYQFHIQGYGLSGFVGTLQINYANGAWGGGYRFIVASNANGIVESSLPIPLTYSLSQNYPNPFNPTTTISYQLPTQSYVTLKVFDVLGKEAATLVNGVEEPGYKSVTFDARKLSSGIYFYRLKSGNYFETKKLMLLK